MIRCRLNGLLGIAKQRDGEELPGRYASSVFWCGNDKRRDILIYFDSGRQLYKQFTIVVRLKEQVRILDPEWLNLLQYVRCGSCRAPYRNATILDRHEPRLPTYQFYYLSLEWGSPRHSMTCCTAALEYCDVANKDVRMNENCSFARHLIHTMTALWRSPNGLQ